MARSVPEQGYYTYEQARARMRELDIRSWRAYESRHTEDVRLHRYPHRFYRTAGWEGWEFFLGTNLYSYQEACNRVREMGVNTRAQYLLRYSEDPRLRALPCDVYPEWKSWEEFLGTPKIKVERVTVQPVKRRKQRSVPALVEGVVPESSKIIAQVLEDIGVDKEKPVPAKSLLVKKLTLASPVPLDEMPPLSERPANRGWYGWDRILGGVAK